MRLRFLSISANSDCFDLSSKKSLNPLSPIHPDLIQFRRISVLGKEAP